VFTGHAEIVSFIEKIKKFLDPWNFHQQPSIGLCDFAIAAAIEFYRWQYLAYAW